MATSDVTIHVPSAVMNLTAMAPEGEVTDADIIAMLRAQLNGSAARVQELEVAVGTLTNLVACALQTLANYGLSDEGGDEFSFSHDLTDRMYGANVTIRNDFAGGLVVKFAPRAPDAIQLER